MPLTAPHECTANGFGKYNMVQMTGPWLLYIACVIASFLAVEAYCAYKYGRAGTLSDHVRIWSTTHPIITFAIGLSVGILAFHFWGGPDCTNG